MFETIGDALGGLGDLASAPGDYLRGALSGRLGERAGGRDMLASWGLDPGDGLGGRIAGFGAELATDPLTYLGGAIGRGLGGMASRAAEAAGPGYATGKGDLYRMLSEYSANADRTGQALASRRVENILAHPNADRLMSEIPEGSNILGAGAEGIAFGTPHGDVARLGRVLGEAGGRPAADSVLQATRAAEYGGGSTPWLAERVPKAANVGDAAFWNARDPATMMRPLDDLDKALAGSGLKLGDRTLDNVGVLGGRPVVIDPGAVEAAVPGAAVERSALTQAAEPGPLMRALLGMAGGQDRTRRAVAAGLAGPDFRTEMMLAGGGLGSAGGALSRAGR